VSAGAGNLAGQRSVGAQEEDPYSGAVGRSAIHDGGLYGSVVEPPIGIAATALDAATFPPQEPATDYTIDVLDRRMEVGAGAFVEAWTFGGSVPGPIIRATEGDTVRIHLTNKTGHPHNLHLHGRHSPLMDGWEPIPPGGSFTYEIEAGPAGVHPYHCHVAPLPEHIARGLYGMFIVDPPGGRAPAVEVALILGGSTPEGMGLNSVVAWNGVAGFYERFPIKVLNMVEFEPLASFHLHAQTFDVYPSGTGAEPTVHTDIVTMGQGERAILEFTLPEPGRYMFHPHQHHLAARGAMGWFSAI
jgi:nitrite reductase (NO-forming)